MAENISETAQRFLDMLAGDRVSTAGLTITELPEAGIIEARRAGTLVARIDRASLDAHDVTGPCPTCGAQR